MVKRIVSLILLLGMVLSCTACVTEVPGQTADAPKPTASALSTDASNIDNGEESGEKVLRIAQNGTPETLGMLRSDGYGTAITQNISDSLVRINADMKLEPGLALSWEWIDENTWQFKLREDVSFVNGEAFNAEAAAYNLNSLTDRELSYRYTSHWGNAWPITAEVVDEYTINVITTEPFAYVPNVLTRIVMYAPEQWQVEGDDEYFLHPQGTGPYMVDSWDIGISLTLKKSDIEYWDGNSAYYDKVIIDCVTSDAARISALQAGEYDIVEEIPFDQVERLSAESDAYSIEVKNTVGVNWMYWNGYAPEDNIVWNVKFREAVAHAIDQEAISQVLFGGLCDVRQGVSPDIAFGGDSGTSAYAYDVELAKQLLAESGYNGEKVYFYVAEGEFSNDIATAEYIAACLTSVGINVEFQQLEKGILDDKRKAGEGEFYMINTPGSFGGMSDYYWNQMESKRGYNKGEAFAEIDKVFADSARFGITEVERLEKLREGNAMLWEQVPVLASWSANTTLGIKTGVEGVEYIPNSWLIFKKAYSN